MNPCVVPTPGCNTDGDNRWMSIHKRFLSECREKDPDVIFIGDCVLESLEHTETWNQYFAPMHCLNFSIRSDRTENVLWRIENGELDNVKPKIKYTKMINIEQFNNLTENQIVIKYLEYLRQIKTRAQLNCQALRDFENYLFFEYYENRNYTNENNRRNLNTLSRNIIFLKHEVFKQMLYRKRKILFWIFYIIIACLLISFKNEASTIVLRNIQTFIYPGMKLWRKITLPIINNFPGLTELYDESCLLMNPLFRVDDLSCEPCSGVVNILDLTHSAQRTESVPFLFKINQDPVHVSNIKNLYENEKDIFMRDAYRVKSSNHDVTNLDELFADFNRTHQIESHNLWRCNRMQPARLLRRLIVKPKRLLPTTGIALERYLSIDTPKASTYAIPDGECSNMYVQQVLGSRIIILKPTMECRHKCRTISFRLPQSFILSYNWWYWRPISVADPLSDSRSISLIGSYC